MALFEEDPDDAEAVRKLNQLYEAEGQRGELLGLKRKQILAAKTPERRVALRLESAPLLIAVGDVEGCIKAMGENLAEDPRHAATVDELTRLLEREGAHARLADLLGNQATRAEEAGEPRAAADLWTRAAEVAD